MLLALTLALLYYTFRTPKPPSHLSPAPGPPSLPLLGNTHQLPTSAPPFRQFIAWARQYGPLYRVRLGPNDWYMLCSPDAVKEVLDRQSGATSSRMRSVAAGEGLSGGMRFLLMGYGGEWRRGRGVSGGLLTRGKSELFKPSQDWEAKILLDEVLRGRKAGDGDAYNAVRRYTVSVMMTSTYGRRVPEWDCPEVRAIDAIMKDFSIVAAPGSYLVETFPVLAKLPVSLQWWRRSLKPMYDRQEALWMSLWTSLKTQMDTGTAPECFVKQLIESDYASKGVSELQAAFLAGSLIEAGSETTSAAINTAILYLSASPAVRAKAHAELDHVVGANRSPTFDDEPRLPYIRAIVKETMRIRPVTNMGTPHYTTAPVSYNGMHIPANSVVAIQQYAIHYNPSLFPDPETFNPDRYLVFPEKSGVYAAGPAKERDHWNFGAGRRICSGLHLAENSMFIVLSKLLWAFDILPPLDEGGREKGVDLSDGAFMDGGNTVPRPFGCRWVVRGEEVRRAVEREVEEARRDGYVLRGAQVGEEGVEV
ncbi:cytochrome P450 76C3 [Polyplosphaeria fusca]|uniref:Cytochrome P450 76C3 n=1 Tax=Polyplosphaeria fusca TaxID=682080 RepID=A0A9P4UYT0_9PLEO|nr:cytochrome P450 76C3 [Polyplosphaeria fusca]